MAKTDNRLVHTRRGLLMLAIGAPAIAYAAAAQGACLDPEALPRAQKALRSSLGFRMVSEDPKQRCGGCAFYTAKEGACGTCTLLSNSPVPAEGRCDSWAPRK